MEQVTDFLTMGGYGAFVWGAFGVTAVVLIGLLVISLRQARDREQRLARLQLQLGSDNRRSGR